MGEYVSLKAQGRCAQCSQPVSKGISFICMVPRRVPLIKEAPGRSGVGGRRLDGGGGFSFAGLNLPWRELKGCLHTPQCGMLPGTELDTLCSVYFVVIKINP